MSGLAAFLAARLDEDEAAAKAVEDRSEPWTGRWQPRERNALETYNGWVLAVSVPIGGDFAPGVVEHIARHDPARVLREVEAGRAILAAHLPGEFDRYGLTEILCRTCVTGHEAYMDDDGADPWPCATVRRLAAVWSDHPDYREEWAP